MDIKDRIEAYAREPLAYPNWQAEGTYEDRVAWDESDITRLNVMRIPFIPPWTPGAIPRPDFLLYALENLGSHDPEFDARLRDFLSGDDHLCVFARPYAFGSDCWIRFLCNVSGSGKTRLLFEALCQEWGFYFVCGRSASSSPYGSSDLEYAIRNIRQGPFEQLLPEPTPRSRTGLTQDATNRRIVRLNTARIVLARLQVFRVFYNAIGSAEHVIDARKKWLLLQLRPDIAIGVDIFREFLRPSSILQDSVTEENIALLSNAYGSILKLSAVDEVQVSLHVYPESFWSSDRATYCPLLSPLVSSILSYCKDQRLMLSGTQLAMEFANEGLRAVNNRRHLRHFHSLGTFSGGSSTRLRFMRHFLSDGMDDAQYEKILRYISGR